MFNFNFCRCSRMLGECAQECLVARDEVWFLACPVVARLTLEQNRRLMPLLDQLSAQEREIVELRYCNGDGRRRSLEEIAQFYGVSIERVRQIETETVDKLRRLARSQESSESQSDASSSETQDAAVEKATSETLEPSQMIERCLKYKETRRLPTPPQCFPFCNCVRLLNGCDDECLKSKRGTKDCPLIMSEAESLNQRLFLHFKKGISQNIPVFTSGSGLFGENVRLAEEIRKKSDKLREVKRAIEDMLNRELEALCRPCKASEESCDD